MSVRLCVLVRTLVGLLRAHRRAADRLKVVEVQVDDRLDLRRAFLQDDRAFSNYIADDGACVAAHEHILESVVPAVISLPLLIRTMEVDLACNRLRNLPNALSSLPSLVKLDASHNRLQCIPDGLKTCRALESLVIHSNSLRPHGRSLPSTLLAAWPKLRELDLRWNSKLPGRATVRDAIAQKLPARCCLRLTTPKPSKPGVGDGGGTVSRALLDMKQQQPLPSSFSGGAAAVSLESQLAPLGTPALRWRLENIFGEVTDPDIVPRSDVLRRLLEAYARVEAAAGELGADGDGSAEDSGERASGAPPRKSIVLEAPGVALPEALCVALLDALRAVPWNGTGPSDVGDAGASSSPPPPPALPPPPPPSSPGFSASAGMPLNDRPGVHSRGYVLLRRGDGGDGGDGGGGGGAGAERTLSRSERRAVKARSKGFRKHLWDAAATAFDWYLQQPSSSASSPSLLSSAPSSYDAVIFTRDFQGSPHVDAHDVDRQVAISLGDFHEGTGRLCVEADACTVLELNTRGRMAVLDGRFPVGK